MRPGCDTENTFISGSFFTIFALLDDRRPSLSCCYELLTSLFHGHPFELTRTGQGTGGVLQFTSRRSHAHHDAGGTAGDHAESRT